MNQEPERVITVAFRQARNDEASMPVAQALPAQPPGSKTKTGYFTEAEFTALIEIFERGKLTGLFTQSGLSSIDRDASFDMKDESPRPYVLRVQKEWDVDGPSYRCFDIIKGTKAGHLNTESASFAEVAQAATARVTRMVFAERPLRLVL